MINTLLPSKNRPGQLKLTLDSIERFCPNLFDINVLYTATDSKYWEGYQKLIDESKKYSFHVRFIKESNFYEDFKNVLFTKSLFHLITDDTVFYKSSPIASDIDIELLFFENPELFSFSFRLGLNTKVQTYYLNQTQPDLNDYKIMGHDENIIMWNFKNIPSCYNYGYFPACDSVVYDTNRFWNVIKSKKFNCLRGLEGFHSTYDSIKQNPYSFASSFKQSVAVNLSVNCVSEDGVPSGLVYPLTTEEINTKYLDGYKLFVEIDPDSVKGCHTELPITFIKE